VVLEIPMAPLSVTVPIALPELATVVMMANKPDEGAKNDPQDESAPKSTPMEAPSTATLLLIHLALRFQAELFLRENTVLFGLSQFHGFPPIYDA
jgi:hypothetical protein